MRIAHGRSTAYTEAKSSARRVELGPLPLHVIPQDIRRLAQQLGFQNGYEVQLSYTRFRPDGRAFLEFSQPEEAVRAASTLNGAILSGRAVHAKLHSQTVDGADNGAEVASREKGQKPDLTVEKSLKGRSVILEGLPEDIRGEELLALLERHQFELESTPDCSRGVRRVALSEGEARNRAYGGWLVQLSSSAEAHRLVRKYHMTLPDNGSAFVQARVIY